MYNSITPEVTSRTWGRCPACSVIRWAMPAAAPVERHYCRPVRLAWSTTIDRRARVRAAGTIEQYPDLTQDDVQAAYAAGLITWGEYRDWHRDHGYSVLG